MIKTKAVGLRTLVKYSLILLCCGLLLSYAAWQARLLLIGPIITLTNPPAPTQSERIVFLEGQAANITGITLNGRAMYTDKNGYFNEPIILEDGYTIATLKGTDRYDRNATVAQHFIYTPE